jgi:hypothetical protein
MWVGRSRIEGTSLSQAAIEAATEEGYMMEWAHKTLAAYMKTMPQKLSGGVENETE